MTQRERYMAIGVGGTLAGLGLWWLVNTVAITPFRGIKKDIADARQQQTKLRGELSALADIDQAFQEVTAQTLSTDPQEAQLLFMENIHRLLARHGLSSDPSAQDTKVSPGPLVSNKADFTRVPVTINTAGTLKQVIGFLSDFYRQNYIARIDKVTLSAESRVITDVNRGRARGDRAARRPRGPRSRRGNAGAIGPDGPELTVHITATTLVLPKVKGVKATPIAAAEEPLIEELEQGDLPREFGAYAAVLERNLFKPYTPPPPPPPPKPTNPTPPPVAKIDDEPTPPQPPVEPPPPPPPDWLRLCGVSNLNGKPVALVANDRDPIAPVERYYHDEGFDSGTLLLIHPQGVVVRVPDRRGDGHTDYFYPLGASFAQREELDPDLHPRVWAALQDEFVRVDAGTSDLN